MSAIQSPETSPVMPPVDCPEPLPEPVSRVEWLARAMGGLAAGLGLAVVFFICLYPIAVVDFWWQAKTGELIVRSGSIPSRDPFSWTAQGQPWLVHEWLTEVLFYLLLDRAPPWMLLAYKCGTAALVGALVMARGWRRSGSLALGIGAALACAWVMRNYADLRPQMLTFILLAGLLLALDEYREGGLRWLPWALPVVFALWSNLHGGVVVGLILVGLWLMGEALGKVLLGEPSEGVAPLALGWAACLLAVAVNPNGFHVYAYPFQVLGHPEVQDYITEWFSPNFHTPEMKAFMFLLLGALGVLALRGAHPGERRCGEALVLAATAYAALTSQRNTVPFAIAAAPMVVGGIGLLWREAAPLREVREVLELPGIRSVAWAFGIFALVAHLNHSLPKKSVAMTGGGERLVRVPPREWVDYAMMREYFPEGAVREMENGRWPGPLYNDYVWGGYLIWRLHPKRPVFIDGRAEVYYPTHAFEDEMTIHRTSAGWETALDRRGVEVVLTSRSGYLANALSRSSAWRWVYSGPVEMVFVRNGAPASNGLPPMPGLR